MRARTGSAARCWPRFCVLVVGCAVMWSTGATYEVRQESDLALVPWGGLRGGDVVRIHWREAPYQMKWVICERGRPDAPVSFIGVRGESGKRPRVCGVDAKVPRGLDYWGEERGVIKVGGANRPEDEVPAHIVIRGLEIYGANGGTAFIGRDGPSRYSTNAAGIYIEKGTDIRVIDCLLRDCGNGLMSSYLSEHVLVRDCEIYGNGVGKGIYHHNVYTESRGIRFERNRLGPLRKGARGNNLKDRSAGTRILYNHIRGGNRLLDLVDSDHSEVRDFPGYGTATVHGNVMIKIADTKSWQVMHFGGDSGEMGHYRQGRLLFTHNTVVSKRRVVLARMEKGELLGRNNVIAVGPRSVLHDGGVIREFSASWLSRGFRGASPHARLRGSEPSLQKDYWLTVDAKGRGLAFALEPSWGLSGAADLGAIFRPGS
ncbi:MAG TPA: polysaccharide-degrading enzyme [Lentisphaeria bacterium]|nr:polysaccharide-degrading enzyme [Lentisphaeria bacterium]